ncbi:MAG: PilZ domain-containing protein [Polyangiales bacterium]
MNTSAGYHQAPRPPRVPLDEVLIKLHPEGFHQEFEADGVNVGAGGLSMRASVLPEVGSTLRCQLENPAGGEAIEMIGRVVWAHQGGPHVGEFGIRFTHLSDDDQIRIEALIQRWGRRTARAPVVRLLLDGVGTPIVAEVRSETGTELSVEQPLPFLAIGSEILNESAGRRGHLEAVELKMDDKTPKLVLSIGYEVEGASERAVLVPGDRDTLPDETPPRTRVSQRSGEERMHDTPRIVRYDPEVEVTVSATAADRARSHAKRLAEQLVDVLGSGRKALTEGIIPRVAANVKSLFALAVRFIGALRSQLDEKPRRKQVPRSEAARAHLKNTRRNGRRYLIVAVMALAIVVAGWGVYWWAASGSAEAEPDAAGSASEIESEAPSEALASPRPAQAPSDSEAKSASTATVGALQGSGPRAESLPPKPVRGSAFGSDAVAGGERFVLQMSKDVTELDGIVEEDGFSVTIPGSLALSRAGPIATAHPDVEHASILNRGDFSELTLRFVAGRHPAYRVEAHGSAIEITIAR